MVGKADNGSFSLVAQFRFCRLRHLESAVCNRDSVRLSESKCDPAETGSAPVRLPRCGKAVRRSVGGGRAALTCGYRLSRHTPEPRATQPFPSTSLPRFSLSGSRHQCLHFVRTRRRAGEICAQLLSRRGATRTVGNISNPLPPLRWIAETIYPPGRCVSITKKESPRSNSRNYSLSCGFLKHGLSLVEMAYRFGIESRPYLQMENRKKNVSVG